MGFLDKFRHKAGDTAKSMLHGHKDQASDAMNDASQKAAEHMPGPASDAMGGATQKAQDTTNDKAEHDMDAEGGHEWPQ